MPASPNLDSDQRALPRQSSSGILSAFRNLTGGRGRQNSPKTQSILPQQETTVSSPLDLNSSQFIEGTVGDAELMGMNGTTQSNGSHKDIDMQSTAGPHELQTLLPQLSVHQPLAVRLKAMEEVTALLEQYQTDNVSGIWLAASDMIATNEELGGADAGFKLLTACAKQKSLRPSDRKLILEAVIQHAQPKLSQHRLHVLDHLSNSGRNLECLETQLVPLLVELLRDAYDSARKRSNTAKSPSKLEDAEPLSEVFRLMLNATRFNSKFLSEEDLRIWGNEIIAICRKTPSADDLSKSIEVLEGIVTYSDLPEMSLKEFVEVLCEIYFQVPELQDRAWTTVSKLSNSHYGSNAALSLLEVVNQDPNQLAYNRTAVRGALLIYRKALVSQRETGIANFDLLKLLQAINSALSSNNTKIKAEVLELLKILLERDGVLDSIFGESEWSEFSKLILRCSENEARSSNLETAQELGAQDLNVTPSTRNSKQILNSAGKLQDVVDQLASTCNDVEFDRKRMVYNLLMELLPVMDDRTAKLLVQYHQDERLLIPFNEKWLSNCHKTFEAIFKDSTRSSPVRLSMLNALHESYNTSVALGVSDGSALINMIVGAVGQESDVVVLMGSVNILTDVATSTEESALFDTILETLLATLFGSSKPSAATPATSPARTNGVSRDSSSREQPLERPGVAVTQAIVRLFLRSVQTSSTKAEKLYKSILKIAGSDIPPIEARIIAFKLLARLRSDVKHAIYIVKSTECETLAATVCRTVDSVTGNDTAPESPVSRPIRSEEFSNRRATQSASGSPSQLGRQPSTSTRPYSLGRVNRPTPPLWMYPGPQGLPEDPPSNASHVVFSYLDANAQACSTSTEQSGALDLSAWLDLALAILTREDLEWETYSYLVVHLGAQLTNHSLFVNAIPQIKKLRALICSQLQQKTFHEPPATTNLKKSDIAICLYHILTMLISYHVHFIRQEQDEMVKVFVFGIGSWERTSETCIHALTICCHELPNSISKSLEIVLQKMSQTVTQTQTSVHILEFLCGLARLPDLFRNFREDEFRTVFGICFRYLQYVRDQRDNGEKSRSGRVVFSSQRSSRELSTRSDGSRPRTAESLADVLPQYVYALAYHVMVFWFMSLKLEDRPHQMAWIIKNLVFSDEAGNPVMEEQSQVVVDMMHSMSFSEHDETVMDDGFAKESDGCVTSKSWLVGMSILTVQTAGRTGVSQIIRRRPSGTRYSIFKPCNIAPRHHSAPWLRGQSESYSSQSYVGVLPDDIVQEFYAPQALISGTTLAEQPVALPDDDMTQRGLSSFDRIPALDGHKIGLVYVGENQTKETEILANVMGSADFTHFLSSIGTLTELQGATFNTQGLDREFDSDGKFTFCWRDRVSEIVFHVPTMMPTNLEHDPQCANKKRHIGNDFVNIIFNNSGHNFDFATFPSDFNYVNIIITPEARASFVETRLHAASLKQDQDSGIENDLHYKVTVVTKPGLPQISPASETKILSGKALPAFVRLQALNADVFSMVWAQRDGGEHVSSWRSRLREITKLRERHCPAPNSVQNGATASMQQPAQQSNQSQPSGVRESTMLRRASAMFGESGGSRNSGPSGIAPEAERSSSVGSRD